MPQQRCCQIINASPSPSLDNVCTCFILARGRGHRSAAAGCSLPHELHYNAESCSTNKSASLHWTALCITCYAIHLPLMWSVDCTNCRCQCQILCGGVGSQILQSLCRTMYMVAGAMPGQLLWNAVVYLHTHQQQCSTMAEHVHSLYYKKAVQRKVLGQQAHQHQRAPMVTTWIVQACMSMLHW